MSWTRAIGGVGSIGVLLDAVLNGFQFLLHASELLFPITSIIYSTIGREVGVGFLSSEVLGYLVVFFATMYVTHLALQFRKGLKNGKYRD